MRDPRAVRFIDWWERNRHAYPGAFWFQLFDSWMEPLVVGATESLQLFDDAAAEYAEREYAGPGRYGNWVKDEPPGMVITDLEAA